MREIEQALELLRQALANKRVPRHVVDDVEIAVDNLEDALREWKRVW
jgi:uncharacterized protein (UPF0147 family)